VIYGDYPLSFLSILHDTLAPVVNLRKSCVISHRLECDQPSRYEIEYFRPIDNGVEPKAHPGSFLLEVITLFSISISASQSFGPRCLVVPAPFRSLSCSEYISSGQ
jgi:hypothetical protein